MEGTGTYSEMPGQSKWWSSSIHSALLLTSAGDACLIKLYTLVISVVVQRRFGPPKQNTFQIANLRARRLLRAGGWHMQAQFFTTMRDHARFFRRQESLHGVTMSMTSWLFRCNVTPGVTDETPGITAVSSVEWS